MRIYVNYYSTSQHRSTVKGAQLQLTCRDIWVSASYRPKNTVQDWVVNFVHTLCVLLGLLWGLFGCFRDGACWGVLVGAIFAARWEGKKRKFIQKTIFITEKKMHTRFISAIKCGETSTWALWLRTTTTATIIITYLFLIKRIYPHYAILL